MNRDELYLLVAEKVNEIFLAYQVSNEITTGDIHPMDALQLDAVQEKLTDLVISVCEYNK